MRKSPEPVNKRIDTISESEGLSQSFFFVAPKAVANSLLTPELITKSEVINNPTVKLV